MEHFEENTWQNHYRYFLLEARDKVNSQFIVWLLSVQYIGNQLIAEQFQSSSTKKSGFFFLFAESLRCHHQISIILLFLDVCFVTPQSFCLV